MAKKRRKKKIKWSGVALLAFLLLVCLGAIVGLLWGLVWLVMSLFGSSTEQSGNEKVGVEVCDPALLRQDSLRAVQVGRLVAQSHQLDSTDLAIALYDATTRRLVYTHHADQLMTPASCMKIPTAIAALERLGMDHCYESSLRVRGEMVGDTLVGELLLQADDDPLIVSFDSLVGMMRDTGIRAVRGHLEFDLTRIDKLDSHPTTQSWDIKEGRLTVLLHGEQRVHDELRSSLSRCGVAYVPDSEVGGQGEWREVAHQETLLKDVLIPTLIFSSNIKAEAVFYHLDVQEQLIQDRQMHWDHKHAVQDFWERTLINKRYKPSHILNMVQATMLDGSGLSPDNRLSANLLVDMLLYAWDRDSLRTYLIDEALASPGDGWRRGSLSGRMSSPSFRDRIFVKTGTLGSAGVSSLAGYIHSTDDHWYIFSIINQNCPVAEGRLFQDAFCSLFVK